MSEPIDPATVTQATVHLTQLHDHLTRQGLHARLLTHGRRLPRLRVINPETATMTEVISAAPLEGQWWFWWSWAEQISSVSEIATTADRIQHVLTPTTCTP